MMNRLLNWLGIISQFNIWLFSFSAVSIYFGLFNSPGVASPFRVAQAPPKEFDLQDFDYWVEQCRSFTSEKLYAEALKACEKGILVNQEKDKKRRQQQTLELFKNRSLILFQLGRYQEAIAAYSYVLSLQPTDSMALTYRCEALFRLGRNESAIASCEQALQVDGDWGSITPATALSVRGLALKQLGQFEAAIASFDQAIAVSPDDLAIRAERCQTVVLFKQRQQATLEELKSEADLESKPGETARKQAQIQDLTASLAAGEREEATCVQTIVNPEVQPNEEKPAPSAYVLYQLGFILKNQGRSREAKAAFKQAATAYELELAADGTDPRSWIYQGMALEELGQDAGALAAYQQALQLNPNLSFALSQQCGVLNDLKRFQEALVACDNALKGNRLWGEGGLATLWSRRSRALVGVKQYEDAIAAADRAIALNPTNAEAYYYKAFGLWSVKDYTGAKRSLDRAIALKPSYAQAYVLRGKFFSMQEQYSLALKDYLKASTNSNCTDALKVSSLRSLCVEINTNLATTLLRLEQFPEALSYARRAAELNPESFDLQYNLGLMALNAQAYQEAATAFRQADLLKPNSFTAITGLGLALKGLGRNKEAMIALNQALTINPNYELARATYDELVRLQKQREAELRKQWQQQLKRQLLQRQ